MTPLALPAEFLTDPYPTTAALRDSGPVHRVSLFDGSPAWLVVGHGETHSALRDRRLSTNQAHSNGHGYQGLPLPEALRNDLLHLDPPRHTRLRRMVAHAFTQRSARALRPFIEAQTGLLLDRVPLGEPVDFLRAVALPLPLTTICDLLGVPADARAGVHGWTSTMLTPQGGPALARAMSDAESQLRAIVAHRRERPDDGLLSDLLRLEADPPSEDEIVSLCFVLLAAGHDTTANFLCNALATLLDPRERWERLVAEPERLPRALDELLRYDAPLSLAIRRFALQDLNIGDARIAAGETVLLSLAAANHDPAVFPWPGEPDLGRERCPHTSFGGGVHRCPGDFLARTQAEVVLTALLHRFPGLELAGPAADLPRRPSHRTRSFERLPVVFG
ncbi:cytochrome P450 [Lentzea sp. NPDC060358]|uniref:cytochrome P450 family protein n=1 Tax=Lentzea sp. NPDC060358 TaxID=3347103 RepID=UPI003661CB65